MLFILLNCVIGYDISSSLSDDLSYANFSVSGISNDQELEIQKINAMSQVDFNMKDFTIRNIKNK